MLGMFLVDTCGKVKHRKPTSQSGFGADRTVPPTRPHILTRALEEQNHALRLH